MVSGGLTKKRRKDTHYRTRARRLRSNKRTKRRYSRNAKTRKRMKRMKQRYSRNAKRTQMNHTGGMFRSKSRASRKSTTPEPRPLLELRSFTDVKVESKVTKKSVLGKNREKTDTFEKTEVKLSKEPSTHDLFIVWGNQYNKILHLRKTDYISILIQSDNNTTITLTWPTPNVDARENQRFDIGPGMLCIDFKEAYDDYKRDSIILQYGGTLFKEEYYDYKHAKKTDEDQINKDKARVDKDQAIKIGRHLLGGAVSEEAAEKTGKDFIEKVSLNYIADEYVKGSQYAHVDEETRTFTLYPQSLGHLFAHITKDTIDKASESETLDERALLDEVLEQVTVIMRGMGEHYYFYQAQGCFIEACLDYINAFIEHSVRIKLRIGEDAARTRTLFYTSLQDVMIKIFELAPRDDYPIVEKMIDEGVRKGRTRYTFIEYVGQVVGKFLVDILVKGEKIDPKISIKDYDGFDEISVDRYNPNLVIIPTTDAKEYFIKTKREAREAREERERMKQEALERERVGGPDPEPGPGPDPEPEPATDPTSLSPLSLSPVSSSPLSLSPVSLSYESSHEGSLLSREGSYEITGDINAVMIDLGLLVKHDKVGMYGQEQMIPEDINAKPISVKTTDAQTERVKHHHAYALGQTCLEFLSGTKIVKSIDRDIRHIDIIGNKLKELVTVLAQMIRDGKEEAQEEAQEYFKVAFIISRLVQLKEGRISMEEVIRIMNGERVTQKTRENSIQTLFELLIPQLKLPPDYPALFSTCPYPECSTQIVSYFLRKGISGLNPLNIALSIDRELVSNILRKNYQHRKVLDDDNLQKNMFLMMRMMTMGPELLETSTSSKIYIRLYDPVLTEGYLQQYDYPSSNEEYRLLLKMFEPAAHGVGDITMKRVRANLPIFIEDMLNYSSGLFYTYLILYTLSLKEKSSKEKSSKQEPDKEPFTLSCSHIFARELGLSEVATYIDIRLLSNQEALALAHEKKYDAREQKASLEAVGIPFLTPFKYAKQCESCLKYLSDQDKANCESCGMVVCHSCRPQTINVPTEKGIKMFETTNGMITINDDASLRLSGTRDIFLHAEDIDTISTGPVGNEEGTKQPGIHIKLRTTEKPLGAAFKKETDASTFVEQYAIVKQRKRIGIQKCQRCVVAEGDLDTPL